MTAKKKLGGIKSVEKHEAAFQDGTKVIDYNTDLVELYNKAVVEALTNQKTDNYLLPFVSKSIKGMMNAERTDLGVKSLDKLESLVKETSEYFQKHQEADNDFIEYKIAKTLFPWQKEVIKFDSKRNTLLAGRRCWAPETLILMSDGQKKAARDIVVGDYVMGIDNKPHKVLETHSGMDKMYEMVDAKGRLLMKVNSEHIITALYTKCVPDRNNHGFEEGKLYDIPVKDFIELPKKVRQNFVVYYQPIEYPAQKHFIDPWLFGLWLGDGGKHEMGIAVHETEKEVINKLFTFVDENTRLSISKKVTNKNSEYSTLCIHFRDAKKMHNNLYLKELERLNVRYNKHIPTEYIIDSKENRLKLMAGLIDSDGSYDQIKNILSFSNTNKTIVDAFISIAHSLGFRTFIRTKIPKCNGKECKRVWEVSLKGNVSQIPCVTPRKKARDNLQKNWVHFEMVDIGDGLYNGFTIEGNGRMLLGDYLITHNSGKSYVESAIAVLHCTRGYDIINGFKKPRSVLIMGLTSERVKDVFWENVKHYVEIANISAKIDNNNLSIVFENGASIILKGNNSKVDREKLRGADYSLIIIDECQSQQSLGYLMTDILGPIIKGRDSFCYLSGTGAITNKGYWKDITDGKDSATWRHFTATMKDNPTVPSTALEDVLKENNWTADNITYRREYLAENITDTTRLIVPNFHKWDALDGKIFDRLCIGIDYGWNDYNAIVALLKDTKGKIYEVETRKFNKSDVDKIVLNVKQVWEETITKYRIPIDNCICVADNSDQSISAQIQKNGVKIQNAVKVDKVQNIIDMKESLNRGDFLVHSEVLTDEFESWVWKYDEENKTVIYEPDDDFYHPDACFAAMYSWRYLKNR